MGKEQGGNFKTFLRSSFFSYIFSLLDFDWIPCISFKVEKAAFDEAEKKREEEVIFFVTAVNNIKRLSILTTVNKSNILKPPKVMNPLRETLMAYFYKIMFQLTNT